MKARTLILFAAVAALTVGAQPSPANITATIICYHSVESPYDTDFSITRESFIQQMQYLKATGYSVITLAQLHDYVTGARESLPPNPVVLTFDDGYRSTYTEVYPILQRFGFPFTAFIYPKWVGKSAYALTWAQIREMSDQGVDIQSHSFSHSFLTRRRAPLRDTSRYSSFLATELNDSKEEIEKHTGQPVRFLAYPYGDYDPVVARYAANAGYDAALTCDFGPVKKGADPYTLRRVVVRKKTSLSDFRKLLGNEPMRLASVEPQSGGRFERRAPVVSAKIANHESLDPASVNLSLLSLGKTPFSYDPRNGTISLVVRDELKGNAQRAFVWATDRKTGKRVEATWTFYLQPPAAEPSPVTAAESVRAGAAAQVARKDQSR
jgi:peptidoglycan/xylan/chitin deacetylase (PgdA/CDA1 family)